MDIVKTTSVRGGGFLLPFSKLRILPGAPQGPSIPLLLTIAIGVFFFGYQNSVNAQITILHSFGDGSVTDDGVNPEAGLIQAPNGDFFGVTYSQAKQPKIPAGTVFRMTAAGEVSVIYRFGLKSNLWSNQPLLYYHGNLIGVTTSGSLFELRKVASTGKWRLLFWQKNLGTNGNAILGSDGNFYGVGAVGSGIGGVYEINPTTHQIAAVFSFPTTANYWLGPGLVEGNDGNFYGSTNRLPGLQYQWGAIFQLTPSGQVTFTQFGGLEATGPMIQASNGTFYGIGATFNDIGTESPGFVFSYTPNSYVSVIHTFGQGSDGNYPLGTVVQGPNSNLYGITPLGGTAGHGIIFEVSTLGNYTIVHNFGDGSVPNDGLSPTGTLVVGKDNNLYGTTTGGGTAGLGTIFKFTP
jgi:uncharacterized repeat protein (TIGR03803 family)